LTFGGDISTPVNAGEDVASLYMELLQYKMKMWSSKSHSKEQFGVHLLGVEKQRGRQVRRHGGYRKVDPLRTCIVENHGGTLRSMDVAVKRRY
jgi:hypothetical protein